MQEATMVSKKPKKRNRMVCETEKAYEMRQNLSGKHWVFVEEIMLMVCFF